MRPNAEFILLVNEPAKFGRTRSNGWGAEVADAKNI